MPSFVLSLAGEALVGMLLPGGLQGLSLCQPCDFCFGDSDGHKQGSAFQWNLQTGEPRETIGERKEQTVKQCVKSQGQRTWS